jgi:glycosyltransferase involved in cell wall biosynthesis
MPFNKESARKAGTKSKRGPVKSPPVKTKVKILENSFNFGSAYSRNKGIEIAKGSYLTFIDSDDIWLPNFLEKVLNYMTTNNFTFVFT